MRIRPYVTLPDPGQADAPPSPQPLLGVVAPPPQAPEAPPAPGRGAYGHAGEAATELLPPVPPGAAPDQDDTPAYGIPVPPVHPAWPDETVPLRAIPAEPGFLPGSQPQPPHGGGTGDGPGNATGGGWGGGGGGAPEGRSGPAARRRLLPLLIGAGAVVALGSAALAAGVFGGSGTADTALTGPKPSAPAVSAAPAGPTQASPSPRRSPSPSASRSASPSPSASRSASPSASASRSASPSPSRSASASRSPSPKAPAPAPVKSLQYGDSGPEVEQLQRLLAAEHLYRGKFTGKFDDRTENAVSTFQWENDITEDPWGVYGPATRQALEG
ncbi:MULTISPECIES: peptidoglycan-binding protein [unclassified Streptomyces]|uniref:peptidoglycan-binding domain-containing protein n=1 Tax=unclassified Streptomyces TaxID=2593676 RepID=UPI001BE6D19E|nr:MULTISPECIES: peptidoglycan-binding domain-containing protein [unclassified Streptomyces]MBT2406488.1 peptidoglycan-binding protein [Streptomyces sp. ISL-21]MBT2458775.1 peptidoglycan-binding protein [Streptomyces sp. ISL-86]MBT2613740.1 peptidoglycan-binding protein [Streptomyces sp. ISL-87]